MADAQPRSAFIPASASTVAGEAGVVRVDARIARSAQASPLARRLRAACRGEVLFDIASRGRYATDASIYQIFPIGVVVPRDEADARAALDVAREEGVPLLARGAGPSQCGQTVGG